jgi:hypothetical protein
MNRLRPTKRWGAPALVVAVALTLTLPNLLDPSAREIPVSEFAPGEAGLRAAIDPETGDLAVGADAMRLQADKTIDAQLRESLSRSDDGLVEVIYPEGHVGVHLKGRFMSTSVARLNDAGEVETLCTDDAAKAEAFLGDTPEAKPETDANGWEVR